MGVRYGRYKEGGISTNNRIKLGTPSNQEEISMENLMQYAMWYQFKKEFERRLGCGLLNWGWLQVKPQPPALE